jgi:eukaryotic-like serine/threonine-protein kinase
VDTTLQDPLIGHVLDDRYRVDQRIAVGGMATVYRATDTRLDRVTALKVMHPSMAEDAGFVERFTREARSTARLDHPNIVGVLDQGTDRGYVYLAMEYVAGCTLRDVLRERGALQPRAVLDIVEPLLAGLAAAHRAGFVHRDMKPENVLIGDDGRVKVADFGLVRGVDSQTSATTDSVLGTVSYLAPEQIEGGAVDARADVYACGVLLYEMLTGAKPHTGDTAARVLYAHVHEDVPPPSMTVAGLAPELDGLVARVAARDPRARPADAAALLSLVRAVRAALSEEQLDAEPRVAGQRRADPDERTEHAGRPASPPAAEPVTGEVGPEDRTRVVPLPPGVRATAPDGERTEVTSRIELPAEPDAEPAARRGAPRRRLLTLVAVALVLLGAGAGVWYINSGQFLRTPGVYDLPRAEAAERLRDAGLQVDIEEEHSQTVEAGHVITTDPERGDRVRRNSTVTITVSQGPPIAVVPNLRGIALDDARRQLADAGLAVGEVSREFSDEVPRDAVTDSNPAPGQERRPNSAVDLVVSRGAAVLVPDVTGVAEDLATGALAQAGFEVEIAEEQVFSAEAEAGTVAEQSPAPHATAGAGDTVTLTMSRGPEMIVVPDVRGESVDDATDTLEAAGFEVDVNRIFFGDTVFNQSVYGGDRRPRGDTITIWVQ